MALLGALPGFMSEFAEIVILIHRISRLGSFFNPFRCIGNFFTKMQWCRFRSDIIFIAMPISYFQVSFPGACYTNCGL